MAVTAEDLARHINARADTPGLDDLLATAATLLQQYVADAIEDVPDETFDRAHLLVAAELHFQDQAPNGVLNQQYDVGDTTVSTPIRINRDPLTPAYPVLRLWMPGATFA